jgi:hypothetical protein
MPRRSDSLTYYVDVHPAGEPTCPHELAVEARTSAEAVLAAREVPGVLLATAVRDWSKVCRPRFPR